MVLTRLPLYVGTALPSFTPVGASRASPAGNDLSAEELVVAYHERTKHHYHRFAASVGYMDWATQPDPFRRYEGASLVRLPFPEIGQTLPYWQLYGIPPLTREEAERFRAQASDWELRDDAHRIERTFRFRNFREAGAFVQEINELAEADGHHPDISFG